MGCAGEVICTCEVKTEDAVHDACIDSWRERRGRGHGVDWPAVGEAAVGIVITTRAGTIRIGKARGRMG